MKIGIAGYFHLVKRDAQTGNIKQELRFPNLITNLGLETFAKGTGGAWYCAVGKGTAAPNVQDTSLTNEVARRNLANAGTTNPVAPDYAYSASSSCRFAAGIISTTITEIGIFSAGGSILWSRQIIVDENNVPVALTVLPNEYLDVTYTLWYYPPLQDWSGSFVMQGVTYNYTARSTRLPFMFYSPAFVTSGAAFQNNGAYETQTLGDITSAPAGTGYGDNGIISNYTWGGAGEPFTWYGTINIGLNQLNVPGGIGSIVMNHRTSMPAAQFSFTPKLPKDSNTTMTLTFSRSVARYEGT